MMNTAEQHLYLSVQDFQSVPAEEMSAMSKGPEPLVSVLMITHNHEAHIVQAIESIVSQQCEFPFELIIGEDCSQDRTREICLDYQKRYPETVRVVFSDENVGIHRNFARIWYRARGKYIAMCEGDDYWVDRGKIAKQASWLEERPAFTMCGTLTEKICEDKDGFWIKCGVVGPIVKKEQYSLEDLIPNYTFHFSSIMLRKDAVRFPRWFWDVYCVDRPMYLLCAEKGPAGFLPQVTSVYRLHEGGIWSPSDTIGKASKGIKLFENIDRYFNGRYRKLIHQTLGNIIWSYMGESLAVGDRISARRLFWLSIHYRSLRLGFSAFRLRLAVFLRLYFPLIFRVMRNDRHKA
jgi:glycosyltransferase involved in cell wall biosynthesis